MTTLGKASGQVHRSNDRVQAGEYRTGQQAVGKRDVAGILPGITEFERSADKQRRIEHSPKQFNTEAFVIDQAGNARVAARQ